jgi:hypothetical protein
MVDDTESVSAGEVCSLETAKKLGIRDTSKNNGYYLNEYSDVKTYNQEKDTQNNSDIYKLCETINTNESKAAPLCVLQSNAGFGFTRQKSAGSIIYDSCVTAECPDGFEVDPKNPNSCIKPKKPKTTLLKNIVEERWYDWFMVPDYHIGNKYARVGDTNFAPCKKGSIPSYEKDPVDGLQKSFNSSKKDDLSKCVEKAKYFGGKYFRSETHCPLTWVYRAGATNKDLKMLYTDFINDIDKNGNKNLDTLKKGIDNIILKEIYDPVLKYGFQDYVGKSQTEEASAACAMLEKGHPERKKIAYSICDTIHTLGEEEYIKKLMRDNQESEPKANQKYKRAAQGCHTLFCKDESTKKKLCFKNIEEKGFNNTETETEPYVIDHEKEKAKVAFRFWYILIIVLSVFAFLVIFLFTYPQLKYMFCIVSKFVGPSLGFANYPTECTKPS